MERRESVLTLLEDCKRRLACLRRSYSDKEDAEKSLREATERHEEDRVKYLSACDDLAVHLTHDSYDALIGEVTAQTVR